MLGWIPSVKTKEFFFLQFCFYNTFYQNEYDRTQHYSKTLVRWFFICYYESCYLILYVIQHKCWRFWRLLSKEDETKYQNTLPAIYTSTLRSTNCYVTFALFFCCQHFKQPLYWWLIQLVLVNQQRIVLVFSFLFFLFLKLPNQTSFVCIITKGPRTN